MNVVPYAPDDAAQWNAFVAKSKNGTFLFNRDYMDYHKDRFKDASLLIQDDAGGLVGIFPASRRQGTIVSHGGLTYGGLVVGPELGTPQFLDVFATLIGHLKNSAFESLEYKTVPSIYHLHPAEEDRYALFLLKAELYRRDVSSAILPLSRLPLNDGRKYDLSKATRCALRVEESACWAEFWSILSDNLKSRHGLLPVHSLEEIKLLQARFPSNIRLFTVIAGSDVVAGTVVYETAQTAHAQYLGCSDAGRKMGALTMLFCHLLESVYTNKLYFNFGISTEESGRFLNKGLVTFKESFGARSIVQDFYRIDLLNVDVTALKADQANG